MELRSSSGLLSNQGETSVTFYFIMVPLRKEVLKYGTPKPSLLHEPTENTANRRHSGVKSRDRVLRLLSYRPTHCLQPPTWHPKVQGRVWDMQEEEHKNLACSSSCGQKKLRLGFANNEVK